MLQPEQLKTVEQMAAQMSASQLNWFSGYVAGLRAHAAARMPAPAADAPAATVLHGSQTGNSAQAAKLLADALKQRGYAVNLFSMGDYKTARLKKERFLFVAVSTHGEGEPPDSAAAFYSFLRGVRAPKLPELSFSVLALGDSSYEHFCQTGRDIHARLKELGASPLAEPTECDLDFDAGAEQWRDDAATALTAAARPDTAGVILPAAPLAAVYDRQNPFPATVLATIELSATRGTRHLELSLENSALTHRPGDSLGVWPRNDERLAKQIAEFLRLEWDEEIEIQNKRAPLSEWLLWRLDIATPTPALLPEYRAVVDSFPEDIAADRKQARAYLNGRGLLELMRDYPPPPGGGAEVLARLRRLAPRLYSLASSAQAREDEAHILVGEDAYTTVDGVLRRGVCSSYLSAVGEGGEVKVYVQQNDNFRPPADDSTPVVMIGPGTGVAPFRAFLEEREERGRGGKNWLFFGERRRRDDFYYQTEWQRWLKSGVLTRLNAAFSRDEVDKVYVQHKMLAHGKALWEWMQDGAYVYVCGDEQHMARDVDATLRRIAATHGGGDGDFYLNTLRESGRYQRDVY